MTDTTTLRTVRLDLGYLLRTYDTNRTTHNGKYLIGYELLSPRGEILFEGEDFGCSTLHSIDSDDALRGLLGFLTLRPGDTDADYFENYTAEQRAFCESSDCEQLQFLYSEDGPGEFEDDDDGEWVDGDDYYGLPVFERDGERYAVAKDHDEARKAAEDYIAESLWAFRSEFLATYTEGHSSERTLRVVQEACCEDSNGLIRAAVGDRFDDLVSDAISADGLGHFLSPYDGEEIDKDDGSIWFRLD